VIEWFELRIEIDQFLRHRSSGIAEHFENEEFIMSLAHFAASDEYYSTTREGISAFKTYNLD